METGTIVSLDVVQAQLLENIYKDINLTKNLLFWIIIIGVVFIIWCIVYGAFKDYFC